MTTATAEWFDVLPAFRGTLVRNFLSDEGICDRLFSLLSFLHIGMLLAPWLPPKRHRRDEPFQFVVQPAGITIGVREGETPEQGATVDFPARPAGD